MFKGEWRVRRIVGGFLFILMLAVGVFLVLTRFLSRETREDVSTIAQTYLEGVSREEQTAFNAMADFSYSQPLNLKKQLETLAPSDAATVRYTLSEAARLQALTACALIDAEGAVESAYGAQIVSIDDRETLLERLMSGENAVASGHSMTDQLILWAVPAALPMTNGGTSVGLVFGHFMAFFGEKMSLNDHDQLSFIYLIRKDGSFLIEDSDATASRFLTRMLLYDEPYGMTAQKAVIQLLEHMAQNEVFTLSVRYDCEDGDVAVHENRSIRCVPVPGSEWYMIVVLPNGVLDHTVERMSATRMIGMLTALMVLGLGMIGVFILYLRMARRQIVLLETERSSAEAARAQADRAREEAERAWSEAEYANRAKSEFLSSMSHDIRTPMNAIMGLTHIAADHVDDPARMREYLRRMTLSSKQLLGLVNDVLDMSKIERGELTLNPEPLDLREVLETVHDIVKPQAEARMQRFSAEIRGELLSETVYCDSVRISQVLLNLLSNAVKFTPEGGNIRLALWQEPTPGNDALARTRFLVEDDGMGMSEALQQNVFEAFAREDMRRVQKAEGSGLGLAITKHIIDAMNGEIAVTSALGEGSSFLATVDLERRESADQTSAVAALQDFEGLRILVVDDIEMNAEIAEDILTAMGAEVECAENGKVALLMFERSDVGYYDAILMDLRMPVMTGNESAEAIRGLKRPDAPTVPIIALSADAFPEDVQRCYEVGMNGHIPKPMNVELLLELLSPHIPRGDEDRGVEAR